MALSMMILSVCIASFPFAHSRWTILGAMALFGMLQGSLFVRHPCLVGKYLSFHEQSMAIDCMEISSGIFSLLLPVYIGNDRIIPLIHPPNVYKNRKIIGDVWDWDKYQCYLINFISYFVLISDKWVMQKPHRLLLAV